MYKDLYTSIHVYTYIYIVFFSTHWACDDCTNRDGLKQDVNSQAPIKFLHLLKHNLLASKKLFFGQQRSWSIKIDLTLKISQKFFHKIKLQTSST